MQVFSRSDKGINRMKNIILAGVLVATATIAQAQAPGSPPPAAQAAPRTTAGGGGQPAVTPARGPGLQLALEAAQAAINVCNDNGYKVGVTVVDSAGVLKVLLAADGASRMGIETSTRKAVTANALKARTSEIQVKVATDQALAAKVNADPTMFARAGAVPLKVGNEVIGAIGVGGAPGGDLDEMCAERALDKIMARLK